MSTHPPEMSAQPREPLDYWLILRENQSLILVCFLLFVLATWIFTKLAPKTYKAETTLFVYADFAGDINVSPAAIAAGIVTPTAQDYVFTILKSGALAESVIARLKLDENSKFIRGKKPFSREQLIGTFNSIVKISANFNRKIVVEADSRNPQLSADVANGCVETLTSSIVDRAKAKLAFLAEQLQKIRAELAQDEEALKRFEETAHWVSIDSQMNGILGAQADTEKELLMDRIKLARNQRLSETSGAVQELVTLEAEQTALQTEIAMLQKNSEKLDAKLGHLPASTLSWARLTREVKVKEDILKTLDQDYEAGSMKQDSEIIPYRVIDRAYPPMSPYRPVMKNNLIVGGFLGLLLGVLLALYSASQLPPPPRPAPDTETPPGAEPPSAPEMVW